MPSPVPTTPTAAAETGAMELLKDPRVAPGAPGHARRLRRGVAVGAIALGAVTFVTAELLFPGSSFASTIAPIFAGFFVVMGIGAWVLGGWAARRYAASVQLAEDGLTAVLRNGTRVVGRWTDPKFALEVSSFRRSGSSEEVFSLAWTAPAGPLPAPITSAGFEALEAEASANGFVVESTPHGKGLQTFTTHVIRHPSNAKLAPKPAPDPEAKKAKGRSKSKKAAAAPAASTVPASQPAGRPPA